MLFALGCSQPKVERRRLGINLDSAYMMLTHDVDMLISDSGQTRYRLISPIWYIYDRPDRREWVFPKSLKLHSIDSLRPGNQLVTADSAIFYTEREEWLLMGNVRIHGLNGERLYTPRLYWQRREKRLYSNDTTYFYVDGNALHGDRFEAADNLSWYNVYNNRGDLRYEEKPAETAPAPVPPASPSMPSTSPTTAPTPTTPSSNPTAPTKPSASVTTPQAETPSSTRVSDLHRALPTSTAQSERWLASSSISSRI